MKTDEIIGLFQCPGCGRVCVGISQIAAERDVVNCANFIETLLPSERLSRSGDTLESLMLRYMACGGCGTPSSAFLLAKNADMSKKITLQPVIAPSLPVASQTFGS